MPLLPRVLAGRPLRRGKPTPTSTRESEPEPEPAPPLAPRIVTYDPQLSSPLFTSIPPEIRNDIFILALLPYQARDTEPLNFTSYGYRPELAYPTVQAVALLRTCRRIYLETHALPAGLHTFVSWLLVWDERGPEGRRRSSGLELLNNEQLKNASALHIFAQQCGLEQSYWVQQAFGYPPARLLGRGLAIRSLTITIRHTDWWGWEGDSALMMSVGPRGYSDAWRQGFQSFPALEELTMELETLDRRRGEMDKVVEEVRQWKIKLPGERMLTTEGVPLGKTTWLGSTMFSGAQSPQPGEIALSYYVVAVCWRARRDDAK